MASSLPRVVPRASNIVGADHGGFYHLGEVAELQRHAGPEPRGGDVLEHVRVAKGEKLRRRQRVFVDVVLRVEIHDAVGIGEWQLAKHDGVEGAEHRRRGADTECQRDDGNGREALCLDQLADGERGVLAELDQVFGATLLAIALHAVAPARIVHRSRVAEPPLGLGARLLSGVKATLRRQLSVGGASKRAYASTRSSQGRAQRGHANANRA
jgi:hypothetical protein